MDQAEELRRLRERVAELEAAASERVESTEDEGRRSAVMLQLVMDNIPQFVFWKNRESEYLGCNTNFARAAGLSHPHEIIGKSDYDLPWRREETEFFRECDRRVIATGEPEYKIIEPLRKADGTNAWLDTNKAPLRNAAGKIVGILGTFEDITERRQAEDRQRRMMSELDHRVKNTLASVLSLAEMSLQQAGSLDEFAETFCGRIHSLARTHEALATARWVAVDLSDVVRLTVSHYSVADDHRVRASGESLRLPPEAASPLCMTLHELTTNALKYGALSNAEGVIEISWKRRTGDLITIDWHEQSGPPIERPPEPGLGTRLIRGFVEHQLGGEVMLDFAPDGVRCGLSIPLARCEASRESV